MQEQLCIASDRFECGRLEGHRKGPMHAFSSWLKGLPHCQSSHALSCATHAEITKLRRILHPALSVQRVSHSLLEQPATLANNQACTRGGCVCRTHLDVQEQRLVAWLQGDLGVL